MNQLFAVTVKSKQCSYGTNKLKLNTIFHNALHLQEMQGVVKSWRDVAAKKLS